MPLRCAPLLPLLLLPMMAAAQDVTIYRCLGPGGKLTLRDSPCAAGETQQVRSMQRPRDPAPGLAPVAPPAPPTQAAPTREVQVIYRSPPRPLYECVTTDGQRYTSESGEGNLRWVPAWTLGYPRWPAHAPGPRPVPPPGQHDRPGHPPTHGVLLPLGGTWVRRMPRLAASRSLRAPVGPTLCTHPSLQQRPAGRAAPTGTGTARHRSAPVQ